MFRGFHFNADICRCHSFVCAHDIVSLRACQSPETRFHFAANRTVSHHRNGGQVVSQTQEEMILIGAFGLFWLGETPSHRDGRTADPRGPAAAFLVALRAFRQRNAVVPGYLGETDVAPHQLQASGVHGANKGQRAWQCPGDSAYCVVEEWTYF